MRREQKIIFSKQKREIILNKLKKYLEKKIIPFFDIDKIILTGSLVAGDFGKYKKFFKERHYRRLYSDIDLGFCINNKNLKSKRKWKLLSKGKEFQYFRIGILDRKFYITALIWNKNIKFDKKTMIYKKISLLLNKKKSIILYKK